MPMRKLVPVLESINRNIKGVKRIGLYANAKSILRKTPEELLELRNLGVKIAYLGVETGNDEILKKIQKGANAREMVEAGRKIKSGRYDAFGYGASGDRRKGKKHGACPGYGQGVD